MPIEFADGSRHNCTYCAVAEDIKRAYIAIDDVDFLGAVMLFSNPEKTYRMTYEGYEISGYTKLLSVADMPFGIKVSLEKE